MTRWALLLLALGSGIVLLVGAGLQGLPPNSFGALPRGEVIAWIECTLAAGALYAAAVWIVRYRAVPGWVLPIALGLAILARLMVVLAPPVLSTDIYRYVWDGRVQAAGINPYRYVPSDPALAPLRDPELDPRSPSSIYPNVNRASTAPTIYPPAAQALFALVGFTRSSIWTMKGVMLGIDLAVTLLAMALLRAAGRPMIQALIWAWNPLVIWEFANEGHIDVAAIAFSALALLCAARARPAWAGAALGVAVLLKLLPAALFPAIWRRWDWRTPVAAAATILGAYACYASVGWRVFGYLGGYAQEEDIADGRGLFTMRLLALLGPPPHWTVLAYGALSLALLGGLAAWVALRAPFPPGAAARADVIGHDAVLLAAATMAVLSPHYPWYLTMMVLPAVLFPAWGALWPSLAGPLLYLDDERTTILWPALVFLPAVALFALDIHFRRRSPVVLAKGAS